MSFPSLSLKELITGILLYAFSSALTLAWSTIISAWKIFWSIFSPKLSDTAPTKEPCDRLEILEAGIQGIQLGIDGGGNILTVDGNGLPFLKNLSETFRKRLGRFADHLSAEDVADRILDHLTLLFTIVSVQLGEVLETQTNCYFVESCRCNQVYPVHGNRWWAARR